MTLSITTFSIKERNVTLGIMSFNPYDECHYAGVLSAKCHL